MAKKPKHASLTPLPHGTVPIGVDGSEQAGLFGAVKSSVPPLEEEPKPAPEVKAKKDKKGKKGHAKLTPIGGGTVPIKG